MKSRFRLLPANRWLEPLLALAVFGGLVRTIWFFIDNAYLPQPFFYEPFDLWMDWFNTAYWSYEKGAYDAWGTVYPPVAFVFLRIFSKSSCYIDGSGYSERQCDWVGVASLHTFFLLNFLLLFLSFRKVDRSTSIPRALALGLGLPSLYGLERGNLIVVCFTFFILAYGPLLKSARMRWLAVGMAVNLKFYMISAVFPQLIRRRWRWFEGAIIATVVVYLVSYGIMGAGTPKQIYDNVVNFTGQYQAITFLDLWYTNTYGPLVSLLTGQAPMMSAILGSRNVDQLGFVLPLIARGVQVSVLLAMVASWIRPEVVPMHRLTFLGVCFVIITAESGGYTQGFLIFFVFMEKWRGFGRCWAIVTSYLLCMPFDFIIDSVPPTVQESYLGGHPVFVTYYITTGPFLRPALILSIAVALSFVTIRAVWIDIRRQGWETRWRFRHDAPIMLGTGEAQPPSH
jgi:hypothetical protein